MHIELGLSDTLKSRLALACFIIWILFIPLLAKFVFIFTSGLIVSVRKVLQDSQRNAQVAADMQKKSCSSHVTVFVPASEEGIEQTPIETPGHGMEEVSCAARVSVIVPAYNEEVGITKTIKSILDTHYVNLQVIVVNDGSTDATDEKVCAFVRQHKDVEAGLSASKSHKGIAKPYADLVYIKLENGGKSRAMNKALKFVDGDIVVTIDGDSAMDKRAIEEIVACFETDRMIGAVGGDIIVANRSKPVGVVQQWEYLTGFFSKRGESLYSAVFIIGGAAAAYRMSVLKEVGAFDESLITEDIDLSMRILASGYKTKLAHDAIVYTEGPCDWTGLFNQRLRWRYGRILTFWKQRHMFFSMKTGSNFYLTWIALPLSLYADTLMLLDWAIIPFSLFYIFFLNAWYFCCLIVAMIFLTTLQVLLDTKRCFHANLILVSPFTWIMALTVEIVEFQALYRSIFRIVRGEGLKWQTWSRVGIPDSQA